MQLESESEDGVDVFQEVESVLNLLLNLLFGAENVTIVLLESPDTNKTAKGTGDLISMKHAKICVAQRQVTIAVHSVREHHAM